jgi:hypothetical protein
LEERTIAVVSDAFIVIVGVAVERFLTRYPLGRGDPAFKPRASSLPPAEKPEICRYQPHGDATVDLWYWVCYCLALAILVSLVLRFLIGSGTHLAKHYIGKTTSQSVHQFITDIIFLMFFGAFLVGAALASSVRRFMMWLSLSSAVGILWSVIAVQVRGDRGFGCWWLAVNFFQCLISLALFLWCNQTGTSPGDGRRTVRWVLGLGSLWYVGIFWFDLQKILLFP